MSIFGFIAFSFIVIVQNFFLSKLTYKRILTASFIGAIGGALLLSSVLDRAEKGHLQAGFRFEMLEDYSNNSLLEFAFGKSSNVAAVQFEGVVNDLGLWFLLAYDYGIVTLMLVLYLTFFVYVRNKKLALGLILLMILKTKITSPIYWLFLVYCLLEVYSKSIQLEDHSVRK